MQVAEEKVLSGALAGVKVVVQMKNMAVGRTFWGFKQALGIRTRRKWCRHSMSREKLAWWGFQVSWYMQRGRGRHWWRGRRYEKNGLGTMWRTQTGGGRQRNSCS